MCDVCTDIAVGYFVVDRMVHNLFEKGRTDTDMIDYADVDSHLYYNRDMNHTNMLAALVMDDDYIEGKNTEDMVVGDRGR